MGLFSDNEHISAVGRNLEERRLGADILCGGCKYGHIWRRRGKLDLTVRCGVGEREVPPDIAECSDFEPHNRMSLYDMKEIALAVDGRVGVGDGAYR